MPQGELRFHMFRVLTIYDYAVIFYSIQVLPDVMLRHPPMAFTGGQHYAQRPLSTRMLEIGFPVPLLFFPIWAGRRPWDVR